MDCALDSGCVFDPVAHVYLFLHLHLAALLPEVELCPSLLSALLYSTFHFPASAIYISNMLYSLRRQLGAPYVYNTMKSDGRYIRRFMGTNYILARRKVR